MEKLSLHILKISSLLFVFSIFCSCSPPLEGEDIYIKLHEKLLMKERFPKKGEIFLSSELDTTYSNLAASYDYDQTELEVRENFFSDLRSEIPFDTDIHPECNVMIDSLFKFHSAINSKVLFASIGVENPKFKLSKKDSISLFQYLNYSEDLPFYRVIGAWSTAQGEVLIRVQTIRPQRDCSSAIWKFWRAGTEVRCKVLRTNGPSI